MSNEKIKHHEMVSALMKDPSEILATLTPLKVGAWHAATGAADEAAEVLGEVKKWITQGKLLEGECLEKIKKELGDTEFYLEALRQELRITRQETLDSNIEKLSERYAGFVYTDEAAINRVDVKKGE